MNKMLTILSAFLLVLSCYGQQTCTEPQKGFFMSYNAMGKRDTLSNLFDTINAKIPKYNDTYTNASTQTTFTISNMHPQMYYNEHHQKEVYVDSQHVNVTLGDIELAFRLDFMIKSPNSNKTGSARGRVLVDQTAYFVKQLLIKGGYLQWNPTQISPLIVTYPLVFDYSDPKLDFDDKLALENMLSGHSGQKNIKEEVIKTFNAQYTTLLSDHLNSEDVIGTLNITYKYAGIEFPYLNAVRQYELHDSNMKGLQAKFFFELTDHTTKCTPDSLEINQKDHGGLQELYSMSTLQNTFKYALSKGLYDTPLDKSYQVPSFQFYMGDLSNFVAGAAVYSAIEPITIECKWDNTQQPRLTAYDDHDIFAVAHEICTIKNNGRQLITVDFDLNLVVRITGDQDKLNFHVTGANIYSPSWKVIDPKFTITDENIGRYYVAELAKSLNGKKVFGTGWQIVTRRFPVVRVTSDYVIVFDPSEI